jgi:hypothetical protein
MKLHVISIMLTVGFAEIVGSRIQILSLYIKRVDLFESKGEGGCERHERNRGHKYGYMIVSL